MLRSQRLTIRAMVCQVAKNPLGFMLLLQIPLIVDAKIFFAPSPGPPHKFYKVFLGFFGRSTSPFQLLVQVWFQGCGKKSWVSYPPKRFQVTSARSAFSIGVRMTRSLPLDQSNRTVAVTKRGENPPGKGL